MKIQEVLDLIKLEGAEHRSVERCGLLGYNKDEGFVIKTVQNKASDPSNFFMISPIDYLRFKKENDMVCVYHTHVIGDEEASSFDMKMSNACCIPFLIYGVKTDKFTVYTPSFCDTKNDLLEDLKCAI
jgi:proteasome lid subunit RPN8/RPN11